MDDQRSLCCDLRVMGTTPSNPQTLCRALPWEDKGQRSGWGPGWPGAMVVSIGRGSFLYTFGRRGKRTHIYWVYVQEGNWQ